MLIANYLTLIRILLSPLFLFVYLEHEWIGLSAIALPYVLLCIFVVSELSDAFDGFVARRFSQVTDLGKILDPMADSIWHICIFLTFTQGPVSLPLVLVFLFIYRDSMVSTLRVICALRGYALAARKTGKIKAVLQAASALFCLVLMIPHSLGHLSTLDLQKYCCWAVLGAGAYTLFSLGDYLYANWQSIKRLLITPAR